uniref:hypothetical protein n=1 Tax=Alistipes sp. TaxID=1872444 RepID=UPI00405618D2
MKKIYVVLSMMAVVASTLFVSCAQKKEPDVVAAPPANQTATYEVNAEGDYAWSYTYEWTQGNTWRGFWQHALDASNILRYTITPNMKWSAYITPESAEYIQFRVVKPGCDDGFKDENFMLSSTTSGNRGSNTLQIAAIKIPEPGTETVTCTAYITMDGQDTPFLTINIVPME